MILFPLNERMILESLNIMPVWSGPNALRIILSAATAKEGGKRAILEVIE